MAEDLKIETQSEGGATVVSLSGSLDVATSPKLKAELTRASDSGQRNIVVDLTQVEFLDSTGLGALMGAHRRAVENDGKFAIVVNDGPIERLLNITGLSRVFAVYATAKEALAGIGAVE